MIPWLLIGLVLFVVGAVGFERAGRLGDYVLLHRPPRTRAQADRALMTVTSFRLVFGLLAAGGVLCVLAGLALA